MANYKLTDKGRGFYSGILQRNIENNLDRLIIMLWVTLDVDKENLVANCLKHSVNDYEFELERAINKGLVKYE